MRQPEYSNVSDAEDVLHILGFEESHDYLADVYDPLSGRYVRFKPTTRADGLVGTGPVAIVDTGLLEEHPDIRSRILLPGIDFTGEGRTDTIGHGTVVALILLSIAPGARLVNAKVVARGDGSGADRLKECFRWLEANQDVTEVNLSAGLYRPRCRADCDVCNAARALVAAGKIMTVAAGNLPGVTACPAKASDAVFTITALTKDQRLATYASPGTKEGFAAIPPTIATAWIDSGGMEVPPP